MKRKKLVFSIMVVIVLIAVVIIGATLGRKAKTEAEKEETREMFQAANLLGRWTIPDQGYSFLIYVDAENEYYLRSDIFYDESTGAGMFEGKINDGVTGYLAAYTEDMYGDNISLMVNKQLDESNTSFDVYFKYINGDDYISNDEDITITHATFEKDLSYNSMIDGTDRFTSSTLDEIIRLLNDACNSFYDIQVGVLDMQLDETGTNGLYGEPVSYDGFIHGTGIIAPVGNGSFSLGSNNIKFSIDPTTSPMTIYNLYVQTNGDRIVFQYERG